MAKVYARLIKKGVFTIEQVRVKLALKPDVLAEVEELLNEQG